MDGLRSKFCRRFDGDVTPVRRELYQQSRAVRKDHAGARHGKRIDEITAAVAKLFGQLERDGLTPPQPDYSDEADERAQFEYEAVNQQRQLAMALCRQFCLARARDKAVVAQRLTGRAATGKEDGDE